MCGFLFPPPNIIYKATMMVKLILCVLRTAINRHYLLLLLLLFVRTFYSSLAVVAVVAETRSVVYNKNVVIQKPDLHIFSQQLLEMPCWATGRHRLLNEVDEVKTNDFDGTACQQLGDEINGLDSFRLMYPLEKETVDTFP